MKIAKWNEKASAILDKLCMENNVKYCNRDDGVVFCDHLGTWLLYVPEIHVLNANNGKDSIPGLSAAFDRALASDSQLVESSVSGWLGGMKCREFTKGDMKVYAQEKFLRKFPKNTMFYVQDEYKPIIAGIWESKKLTVIGFVLPVRLMNRTFEIA